MPREPWLTRWYQKWIFVICLVTLLPACQMLANDQSMVAMLVLIPIGLLFVLLWILSSKGEGREEHDDSIPDYDEDDEEQSRDDEFRF